MWGIKGWLRSLKFDYVYRYLRMLCMMRRSMQLPIDVISTELGCRFFEWFYAFFQLDTDLTHLLTNLVFVVTNPKANNTKTRCSEQKSLFTTSESREWTGRTMKCRGSECKKTDEDGFIRFIHLFSFHWMHRKKPHIPRKIQVKGTLRFIPQRQIWTKIKWEEF